VRFDADELGAGRARPRTPGRKTAALVKYEVPQSPALRIVGTETGRENAPGEVGEIWLSGENVADGYWGKSPDAQTGFGATLADPSPGTPAGPWLRTGDLGFVYEDSLFIVGRIKDLLIVRGRNHAPEDIESTVQEITGGRVAAIAVPVRGTEELVAVAEVKRPGDADAAHWGSRIRSEVTAAVANAHGVTVGDLVLVSPGSIPTTTSGKIRRAECAERYRQEQFARVDGE
jgi:fatty acid CoA ligase FadD21